MSNWVGYAISVNCGEPLGCYQGTILEADGSTITLTKAFRNGFPYPKSQVTLNAADIKDLKIIESRAAPAEQTHSTVAVSKNLKKAQRATVCENLQANPTSSGNQAPPGVSSSSKSGNNGNNRAAPPPAARSKPIDIQPARSNKNVNHADIQPARSNKNVNHAGECGNKRIDIQPARSNKNVNHAGECGNKRIDIQPARSNKNVNHAGECGNKRIDIQPARSNKNVNHADIQPARSNKNVNHAGSYGNTSSTPKSRAGGGFSNVYDKARRRNEACFGELADAELDNDFDFEGNLALFNKRALWEELRNAHKPDVVRHADDVGKFRHDENVLAAAPAPRRAIVVPDELRADADYVTDDGLSVPGVQARLRARVWAALARRGLRGQAHTLLARAAADVALRLVGGGRRLDPRNAHQAPSVVALVGPHAAGAAGLQAARLLASHGARAAALLAAPAAAPAPALAAELAAAAPAGVLLAPSVAQLPSADVVLLALYDPVLDEPQEQYQAALEWAARARGALVCVEPPACGWAGLRARAAVLGALPAALPATLGLQYLADVCVPAAVFAELQVTYRPPFGAASVLALHRATADD
ncbi:hypothetical protein PYW08_005326 [Mythimna loreyi]|uniref:Uncharacterized protein n=1 Tax=Mythimna loreyi TaxID=667449 RepID=A0ACC2QG84_9NEOP|nr:hypothetical protein PYW08_005326 [Mythimna loreyi]